MKSSDEAIEKVMAGLRNSEPPAGMELRILAAAKHRQSAQPASGWLRNSPLRMLTASVEHRAWRAAFAATAAGVILAVLAISAIHHNRKPATQSKLQPNLPVRSSENAILPLPNATASTRVRPNERTGRLVRTTFPMRPHKTRSLDHPAPAAPLTQQEKLLVRIAQSRNPHALAMLNTEIRTKREAEEDAEFQRFADQSVASPNGGSE
jgi:hypothetical protein